MRTQLKTYERNVTGYLNKDVSMTSKMFGEIVQIKIILFTQTAIMVLVALIWIMDR